MQVRVRVRVFNCATDLRIFRGNHRQYSCSKQPSSTSLSANLALSRTSLGLIELYIPLMLAGNEIAGKVVTTLLANGATNCTT